MAREGKIRVEIERIQGKSDQFKRIVRETEDFYDKIESNPLEIGIGDIKQAVIGIRDVQKEYYRLNNEIENGTRNQAEFANVLSNVLSRAEDKFDDIGIMFKNVSNDARKYVTGFQDILRYLGDSNFGVKFLDIGARFKELQEQAESLFDSLKMIGSETYDGGEFVLYRGSFDESDLIRRIDLLRELKSVQEEMKDFDPDLRARDFVSGQSISGLQNYVDEAEKFLELLRKSGIETTKELERQRDAFVSEIDYHSWDRVAYESAKENLDDSDLYASYLQDLRNYINERENLLEQLSSGRVHDIFTYDELDSMRETLEDNLSGAKGQLKELEKLKNIGQNVDLTEVVDALKEIRDVINEIKNAFEPLTTALNTDGTAFSNMAKEGAASLDTLLGKLQELGVLMDSLNKKEFSNQTILQQVQAPNTDGSLKKLRQEARDTLNAYEEIIKLFNHLPGTDGDRQKVVQRIAGISSQDMLAMMGNVFDPSAVRKAIRDAKSVSALEGQIDVLDDYRDNFIKLAQAINKYAPGSFDMTKLLGVDDVTAQKNALSPAATNVEGILNSINSSREKMEQEFVSLRESLEKVFDFSTIDPDYQHIESITSKIYAYFEELHRKVKALDFSIDVPEVVVLNTDDKKVTQSGDATSESVTQAADSISKEGNAAQQAALQKEKFAEANKDVAKTAEKTAQATKAAADGIEEEAKASKSAIQAAENLANAQSKIKTPGEAAVLRGLTQADFEDYAAQIAANQGMKLDNVSVTLGELDNMRLATVKMINEELAQSITYTYRLVQLEDDLTEAYLTSATHTGNINKAQKQAIAQQKRADKEKYRNTKWLIQQQAALDKQETKYRHSSKPIDGSIELMSTDTSLSTDAIKTIDSLAEHIKTRIKLALSSGTLTDELKTQILNDLRILQNEIAVQQNMKYSATTMKASTVETNKKAYEQFLNAFEARAKKANVFSAMEQDLIALRAELEKVTDSSGLDKFVENLKVARNKLQAETAKFNESSKRTNFQLDIDRQVSLLTKQQAQWNKNGQLTDELNEKINEMFDSLVRVTNSSELSAWKKQWAIVKDEVAQTRYEIEATNKAQMEANSATKAERQASSAYWDGRFKDSVADLGPKKNPELEQLKVYMLSQAAATEDAVVEQYNAIMTIISQKNIAMQKLMSAKGPAEQQYWQDEYSAWFGAWRDINKNNVISEFFEDASNQAMLGADRVAKFNKELERSAELAAKHKDAVQKSDEQEAKRIASEEDAAWKQYNAEKEAQAQKEREIALAYEAKAAQEAAEAEKELAQARKAADEFFKEEETRIQKELNDLYDQRKTIIAELISYTKQLSQATDEATKQAAQQAIDSAASRLNAKNAEIFEYGDFVDVSKLNRQDDALTDGVRKFNWENYIKSAGRANKAAADDSKLQLNIERQFGLLSKQQALWEKNGQLTDEVRIKIDAMLDSLIEVTNSSELAIWKTQWAMVKDEVAETKYQIEAAKKAQSEASAATDAERKASGEYWNARFKESVENLGPKKNPELEKLKAYYKEQEKINKQNQNYGKSRYNTEYKNYEKLMASVRSIDGGAGLSQEFDKQVQDYEALILKLKELRQEFENNPDAINNSELTKQFQDTALQAEKARKNIQSVIKEVDKLEQLSNESGYEPRFLEPTQIDKAKDAMFEYANEISNGTFKLEGFNQAGTEMYGTLVNSEGAIERVTVALNKSNNMMGAYKTEIKDVETSWQKVTSSVTKGVKQLAGMYLSLHDGIRYLRQGYQYVKDIDDAMTELKKVTDETQATYEKFGKTASEVSKQIGTTMSEFITSTADWSRLGYNLKEATELAKNTSILMNVSEFEDITKATDTMISALQAFKTEGTDVADLSTQILDAYNEVGNSYAISTADLADSLTRSAASLVAANNTLSESIALTTAANTTIQNPESVGTALKTLSMRLRGTSVEEITAAGEETDGLISSTSKLAKKIQELTSIDGEGGVKILTESGDFKSTYQILLEIAQVWHEIDDIDQAALLEVIAGKRAGSVVASILNDAKLLENVFESAENSAGSAWDELQVHLDSIQGRIDILTTSMQTMWNNFLDSEVVKWFIDQLTAIVTLVDKIGVLPTAIGVFTGIKAWKKTGEKTSEKVTTTSITNAITTGFDKVAAAQQGKTAPTSSTKTPTATTNAAVTGASSQMGDTVKGLTQQKKATDDLNKSQQNLQQTVVTGDNIQRKSNVTKGKTVKIVKSTVATQNQENVSTNVGIIAKLKHAGATALQTAKTLALKAAMAGLQMVTMMVVGALINYAINAAINAGQAMEDLKTEAINTADALNENRKAISDYKDEINDLRATLASNTASEKDAYDARVRLMEIQDALIDKYGYEAKGINLVTGAIEDQIAKINQLDESAARDYTVEYKEAFDDAKKNVEKNMVSALRIDDITDEEFKAAYSNKLYELGATPATEIFHQDGVTHTFERYTFEGTRQEIADSYDELVDWLYDYAETHQVNIEPYVTKISNNIGDLGLNDEDYKKDLEVYNNYLENKAVSDYTDVYGNILDAQGKYKEALISGDIEAQQEHRETLANLFDQANTDSANDEAMNKYFADMKAKYEKEWAQLDFSADIKGKNKKMLSMDGENVEVDINSIAQSIKKEFSSKDLVVDDVLNIGNLLTAEEGGQDVDWTGVSDGQINAYKKLEAAADAYGLEVKDLLEVLNRLGYIKYSPTAVELTNVGKSLEMLSSGMETYQTAMVAMKEITYDNMQVSQDYYTALADYIGDNAKLSEAIYTENGEYIVTNTELLKDLIKQKQKEQANNVKLSRSQARLRYYELYKEMRNLTNGKNKLTGAALDEIHALYQEMSGIEKTIAKYSLLETKLLGVTNAYTDLEAAQAADEEMDYGSKAEEMVNALATAFNTAELGTEAAQVAFEGLIPDDVIDKTKTLDEQMAQAYSYFTKGKLSKLFTIEFDDEGAIESVEMTKENVEKFVNTLLKEDLGDGLGTIFEGTWDEFTLNPAITSLEQFADACGLTEEVAFSFLTSLEKYDIGWLGDDFSTLLDQLMGDDLDYQLNDKIQKLADLEMKIANGTITEDEQKSYGTLIGEMEVLEEHALTSATRYGELSGQLDETKQEMIDLNTQLAETEEGSVAYEQLKEKINKAQQEASDLVKELDEIGEPTAFTLQVALDEAQEQIDTFKNDINKWAKDSGKDSVKINAVINEIDSNSFEDLGLIKTESGIWKGTANIEGYSSLDQESKNKVIEYLNLINSKHTIDALMGDGITTIEEHLDKIVTILEKTYELTVNAQVDDSEVDSFVNWLKNTTFAKTVTFTAKKIGDAFNDIILGGGVDVNGTAHARGTAFAGGKWGAPKTETALVGELGPEMVVRGNRWFTVGENGAEFTDIKKGDIIFNHKQTEDLLSKGYVTGRGKAYASGTAYRFAEGMFADDTKYKKQTSEQEVSAARQEKNNTKKALSIIETQARAVENYSRAQASINTWDDAYNKLSKDYANKDSDSGSDSGSDKDDSEQLIDFIEIKIEEIEHEISHATAKLENYVDDTSEEAKKQAQYDRLVAEEKKKQETYEDAEDYYSKKAQELLKKVNKDYQEMAQNGAIAIKDFVGEKEVEQAEAIQEYRDMATKANDAEVAALESIARIEEIRLEEFNDLADDYDNVISLIDAETALFEAQMDLQETMGERLSEKYYHELIKNTNETISELEDKRYRMQRDLKDAVKAGDVEKGSDVWYEMVNAIHEVDEELIQCSIDVEDFKNKIQELKWTNFEKLVAQLDVLDSELSHVYKRLTDVEKVSDKDGVWTDKATAAMGIAAQQMELAQIRTQQYIEKIQELEKTKAEYSTDEYNEKLAELTEGQWESIEAYEDAKDAIIDLNKTRIDAIKEGIEEEIDAYKELIDKKKEALDADKDLYDFEKNVAEQQKDITTIERKLAALRGDSSTSAAAQRKQLEAELAEARAELEDTYYDRSIENQKNALDQEAKTFEESKNAEMKKLDKWLEDENAVIKKSLNTVKINTNAVLKEINTIANQYGITLSSALISPWEDGKKAIESYKTKFSELSSSFSKEVDKIIKAQKDIQDKADQKATEAIDDVKDTVSSSRGNNGGGKGNNNKTEPVEPAAPQPEVVETNQDKTPSIGDTVTVSADATNFGSKSGNKQIASFVKGGSYTVYQTSGDQVLLGKNGVYTGWFNKDDLEGYAKGTASVQDDQFAWIDEIGEELVLHADGSGKLSYLTKGSSVIPADLTEKLMRLAVDPTQTLENSRPIISAPHITNNEINISMDVAEVVHIDTVTNDTIPDLTKAIDKQLDKYMKSLNNQIRKYSR